MILFSCLLSLFSLVGFVLVWIKLHKPHDDPRLSRGLQFLQTKMSVLEDLSERIDTQASQLFSILESKRILTDELVKKSNENHQRMEQLIRTGTDALKVFDSQNPIEEMVKEKNISRLNQARSMISSGFSAAEVVQELGLSRAEVDFLEQVKRPKMSQSYTPQPPPTSMMQAKAPSSQNLETAPPSLHNNRHAEAPASNYQATKRVEIQRVQFPRITSHSL